MIFGCIDSVIRTWTDATEHGYTRHWNGHLAEFRRWPSRTNWTILSAKSFEKHRSAEDALLRFSLHDFRNLKMFEIILAKVIYS